MNDKLYIIGNGFDLHHGLNTSYSDFRDSFAKKNQLLWKFLSNIYGNDINNDMWWSQFEIILANIDYVHLVNTLNGAVMGGQKVKTLFKGVLPPLFGMWLNKMEYNNIDIDLNIDTNAQFFTFNYTLLLENVYKIRAENIWHIHGSLKEVDNIIVGHDSNERELFSKYLSYKNNHVQIREDIADNIRRMAAKGAKGVAKRIKEHRDEFRNRYMSIKHIIAMGFSFNDIDMPYVEAILDANTNIDNIKWTIYYHNDGEDDSIINKLLSLNINHANINHAIKW